jgi:hypothetical protein
MWIGCLRGKISLLFRALPDDADGGAASAHYANYLTFHRFKKLRSLDNFPE